MSLCPTCKASFNGGEQFCPRDGTPLRSSLPEDPLAGRVLSGRYRLQEVIGRGGMGAVYRAHHILMDKAVAVKVLRSELASDTEAVARFHREARSASRLDHEHIIRVTDFGQTDDGLLFLVMELLDGENLAQVLSRGPLPWRRAAAIAREIGLGLSHAHEQGVIHRDLKPENIVLVRRGKVSRQVVKVLDFGLAKLVHGQAQKSADAAAGTDSDSDEPDVAVQSLTRTGVVFGTPEYMSPEQAEGRSLDARADLYALGVVFYQMVTGRLPFTAPTFLALIAKTVHEPPPRFLPSAALADVPDELEHLILTCLGKHPDERPQTADELVDTVERLLAAFPGVEERSSERRLPVSAGLAGPPSGAPLPKQVAPAAAETLRPVESAAKDPEAVPAELPLSAPEPAVSSDPPGGVARTVPRALPKGRTPKTVLAGEEPAVSPPTGVEPVAATAPPADSLADAYSRALRSGAARRDSLPASPPVDEAGPVESEPRSSGRHPAKSSSRELKARSAGSTGEESRPKRSGPHAARSGSALRVETGLPTAATADKAEARLEAQSAPGPAEALRKPISEELETGDEPLRVPRRPYWLAVAAGVAVLGGIFYIAAPRAFYRPPPAGPTVSESLRRARLLLDAEPLTPAHVEEALRALSSERATNNSPEVHRLLGRAYEAQNNRLRALGHLYTASRLGRGTSEEPLSELKLSQLLSRLGHKPEACQAALRALESRPPPGPDVRAPAEAIVSVLHCKK